MASMASEPTPNVTPPAEPVQRRPSDALWFTVLIVSVATGIGMTIFAPVGDVPPARPIGQVGLPSTQPGPDPFAPTTSDAGVTLPATSPAP